MDLLLSPFYLLKAYPRKKITWAIASRANGFVKPIEVCRAVTFFIYAVTFCYLIFKATVSVVLKGAPF